MSKVLLYFAPHDPCCDDGTFRSHDDLLKSGASVGTAYLVDRITGNEWGDDWNDAPSCCNSGPPYREKCEGLVVVEVCLGKPLAGEDA